MSLASVFRRSLCLVALALVSTVSPWLRAQSGSTAADGFNPTVDGPVNAMVVQPDGNVILGGQFSNLQPNGATTAEPHSNIARVLRDGRSDTKFRPGTDGAVEAIALQPDGKIIIAGSFAKVWGKPHAGIARLNSDGTVDDSFTTQINPDPLTASATPDVATVALQADGKILIGGAFAVQGPTTPTSTVFKYLARLNADGSVDTSFNPAPDAMVRAIAVQKDGQILVGGGFLTLNSGSTSMPHLVRLSAAGAVDATFAPKPNNAVNAIDILPNGQILIGGLFEQLTRNDTYHTVMTGTVKHLARLESNGDVSVTFGAAVDGTVWAIKALPDGRIAIGGAFNNVDSTPQTNATLLRPNGVLDPNYFPNPNSTVNAVAVQPDGAILLGGTFNTFSSFASQPVPRNHVVRISPIAESLDVDFRPDANARVRALRVLSTGQIIIGGTFTSVGGATHTGLARLDATGKVDPSFSVTVNGAVLAAAEEKGQIVFGGSFSRANGALRSNVARVNADGSLDYSFDPAPDGQVDAIAVTADNKVVLGGSFTQLKPAGTTEPISRPNLARMNADGTLDVSFNPSPNNAVLTIVANSDGTLLVGGPFSTWGSGTSAVVRYGLARLTATGVVDTKFNPNINGAVRTLAVQTDGKIIAAGSFGQMAPNGKNGTTPSNIVRLNADGTRDDAFDPRANRSVEAVLVQSDNKIIIGGAFTQLAPNYSSPVDEFNIARLNTDGTVDTTFKLQLDPLPGNEVSALAALSNGQVLVAGSFNSASAGSGTTGIARSRLLRIAADGTPDASFNSDTSAIAGMPVEALALQQDGRVLAAGTFSDVNGLGTSNVARFNADGSGDSNFVPSINGTVHAVAQIPAEASSVNTPYSGFGWLQTNGQLLPSFTNTSQISSIAGITAIATDATGALLVGASVTFNDNTATQERLIRIKQDGTVDRTFSTGMTAGTINVIKVLSDGRILIGGSFFDVGGSPHYNIARLSSTGAVDTAFDPTISGTGVRAIEVQSDGNYLVGGLFTSILPHNGSKEVVRSNLARINADASVDATFNPGPNGGVNSLLLLSDGSVLVGGAFSGFNLNASNTLSTRRFLARVNKDGTLNATDFGLNDNVTQLLAQSDGKILVAGDFTALEGTGRSYLARLNNDANLTLDTAYNPNPNSVVGVMSLDPTNGKLVISGFFTALQPGSLTYDPTLAIPRNSIARLNADGTVDPSFNPDFNAGASRVYVYQDGTVVVAGSFTSLQPTGSLLAGGSFSSVNGLTVSNLVLFAEDGSVSSSFLPNPNGAVYALVPQPDGKLVIGGTFTTLYSDTSTPVPRTRVARFNADHSLDTSFNPTIDGDVYVVLPQPDGKLLIGGAFATVGGAGHANLARLNADGSVDGSFTAAAAGAVHAIALQPDGHVVFTANTGATTNQLMRVNADGSDDKNFAPNNDGLVNSVAMQSDGSMVVGGSFTTIRGAARSYIARLKPTGELDPSIDATPDGAVTAVMIQPDGKAMIAGLFSHVDGLPRYGLARISASATVASSFTVSDDRTTLTWNRSGPGPQAVAAIFESSADGATWTSLGAGTPAGTTGNWQITTRIDPVVNTYLRVRALVPSSPNTSMSLIPIGGWVSASQKPVITSPAVVNGTSGSSFAYAISATGSATNPTSYTATGLPPGLTLSSSGLISGTPTQTGTFNVALTATNAYGTASQALTILIAAPGPVDTSGRLINLSVLAPSTATDPIIAGFVISGSQPVTMLVQGIGPTLTALGVSGALPTPNLKVFQTVSGQNIPVHESNAWGGHSEITSAIAATGATPYPNASSADAAALLTLAPGAYTLHLGPGSGDSGTGLAALYDTSPNPPPAGTGRLVNISARGNVATGTWLTAGFVISGSSARHVLIRGVGPGLTGQGVSGASTDSSVTLHSHSGSTAALIAQNDDWGTPTVAQGSSYPAASAADIAAAASSAGAFALTSGSKDAAILVTLPPGIYTAEVSGANGAVGAVMVEVYEVP